VSDNEPAEYLTPREASRITGQSLSTLGRYMDTGKIRGRRLPSGHRRYHAGDVRAIVAGESSVGPLRM
jgi:predicted site-specific integrase-resolvase